MSSSTMNMGATATSSGMSMATSSGMGSHMDMGGSMGGGMTMSMADMAMVFFTSTVTPLYSNAWTPNNAGQYAGTCIFLIILPVIFRAILAVRFNLPAILARTTAWHETDILRHSSDESGDWKEAIQQVHRPWSINEALLRATLDTLLAGVSYLM